MIQQRENNSSAYGSASVAASHSGRLDGLTILRFAHAYESGGGLEQYLADLNLALGRRNRLTIVQIQLTTDRTRLNETEEKIDESRLIKIPLWVKPESKHEAINGTPNDTVESIKAALRNRLLFASVVTTHLRNVT